MTDPRLTKIEAARNEIKTLATDLHTLPYMERRASIAKIDDLSFNIYRLNWEIASYPYVEGTFTEIKTSSRSVFDEEVLYVSLDGAMYLISKTGHILPSAYAEADPELSDVRHVCVFLEESNKYKDSMDSLKEVTGEDMKIGYDEQKYDGWGFSHNGHDYMFYKGSAVRRSKTDN